MVNCYAWLAAVCSVLASSSFGTMLEVARSAQRALARLQFIAGGR
jgi:hypothetical protein